MNKSIIAALAALIVLTIILLCFWIGGIIMKGSSSDILPQGEIIDYVIIPGCRLEDDKPGRCLDSRIDAAVKYLRSHSWSMVVCSGGQGSDEIISEAEAISQELQRRGIHKRRIIIEDKSTSTYENMANVKNILDARKGDTPYSVVITTNDFHIYRTRLMAEAVGFKSFKLISAKTPVPLFYPNFFREIPAVLVAWIKY